MARQPRIDAPGAWHHVMNRGQAQRPVFQTPTDQRDFLGRLARMSLEKGLEVHAYTLLGNHYHLLVRSRRGSLSRDMAWLQNGYVRAFNCRRGRDGALFRGRFTSRLIPDGDEAYWRAVVRYIDHNPVAAGLAPRATAWPLGSAYHYARRSGPPWLHRSIVEGAAADIQGHPHFDPAGYEDVFGPYAELPVPTFPDQAATRSARVIAARRPTPAERWLRRQEFIADGRPSTPPRLEPAAVLQAVEQARGLAGFQLAKPRHWRRIAAALLRNLCRLPLSQMAVLLGGSKADMSLLVKEDDGFHERGDLDYARAWSAVQGRLDCMKEPDTNTATGPQTPS